MRMSGGRGADVWMLAIPLVALAVAASMSAGGLNAAIVQVESAIRHAFTAAFTWVANVL